MWADKSVIYHFYPLGFCETPEQNDFISAPVNRISKICGWIEHIKNLGVNAVLLGPVFESSAHGYDTADFFHIDRRLGSKADFKAMSENLHQNGLKLILDGVFNHVGRDFWAFRDVLTNGANSKYCNWFELDFSHNNQFNDGFCYHAWEGCQDLISLNLKNYDTKQHIFAVIKSWVEDYDIDGLRLDVAYCLDKNFLRELRTFCKNLKPDFWLMGETLHGNYNRWMNDEMLDSVTNYECYKGLFSSCNSHNMFEIAHSFERQFSPQGEGLYLGKHLYNFVDNHDVSRIAAILKDKRHLPLLYVLLFTMNGIPSLYYGSEWGIEGQKKSGDQALRPSLELQQNNALTEVIKALVAIHKNNDELLYGTYKKLQLSNECLVFERRINDSAITIAVNIGSEYAIMKLAEQEISLPPFSAKIYKNSEYLYSILGENTHDQ